MATHFTVKTPVTRAMRDEFAMQTYTAMQQLTSRPTLEAWEAMAQVINLFAIATRDDKRRSDDFTVIHSGLVAMTEVEMNCRNGISLPDAKLDKIRDAVNTIDSCVGKMSVEQLYAAMHELNFLE